MIYSRYTTQTFVFSVTMQFTQNGFRLVLPNLKNFDSFTQFKD